YFQFQRSRHRCHCFLRSLHRYRRRALVHLFHLARPNFMGRVKHESPQADTKTMPEKSKSGKKGAIQRMDNVLIVVEDLEAVKAFFLELGLELEGETTVEGPLVGKLIGLEDVRATLAMLRTPDGQGIELDKFHTPEAIRFGPVEAPVNALGL